MIQAKYLLILGAGTMQGPAIREAASLGFSTIVCDGNPDAPMRTEADVFFPIDLKDFDAIITAIESEGLVPRLCGVFTAGTDFSYSVARIAQHFGLPGIPPEVAHAASNKAVMRQIFRESGVPSPRFILAGLDTSTGSVHKALDAAGMPLPLVVKPVDNMGARGVITVSSLNDLGPAIQEAQRYSRSQTAIIEDHIQGAEYSIDALYHQGECITAVIARRHICFPPYSIEVGHTIPSDLNADQEHHMLEIFHRGVAALGIKNGAAKGDVFFTDRGPVIGEIAARLSGGYMSGWTLPGATGIPITRIALQISLGTQPLRVTPWELEGYHGGSGASAERAVISFPGTIQELIIPDFSQFPGVKYWFPRVSQGDFVRFPQNNVEKAGNIIAFSATPLEAEAVARNAVAAVLLRLNPDNPVSRDLIDNPALETVPPAYPENLHGNHDPSEVSWDGRTLEEAQAMLHRYGGALDRLTSLVLRRYGLQAALIVTDIGRDSREQELLNRWEERYCEAYT